MRSGIADHSCQIVTLTSLALSRWLLDRRSAEKIFFSPELKFKSSVPSTLIRFRNGAFSVMRVFFFHAIIKTHKNKALRPHYRNCSIFLVRSTNMRNHDFSMGSLVMPRLRFRCPHWYYRPPFSNVFTPLWTVFWNVSLLDENDQRFQSLQYGRLAQKLKGKTFWNKNTSVWKGP